MKSVIVILCLFCGVYNERILFLSHFPSISHQKVFRSIWKELSLRGHEVVATATDPLRDPTLVNLTEIDMSIAYRIFENFDVTHLSSQQASVIAVYETGMQISHLALDLEITTPGFRELMKLPSDYFDLLIVETHDPILFGIEHKFKAPWIAISSLGCSSYVLNAFGSSIHPILYPEIFSGRIREDHDLSIGSKIKSIYEIVGLWFQYKYQTLPYSDKVSRKYFGENMPYVGDILRNASLLLCNVNPIFSSRRPHSPNVIEYFNVHIAEINPLPNDLQKILDEAKNGVVYFSLGTNVRFDHVQGDVKEAILQALGELPFTVLCKWESEDFPGKPKNVILRKWLPQQSILAHKNIKVFVTQGGLQSSEEAISNGVPMVVIPFLADQPMNAKILTKHGIAETILPKVLEKDILRDTILKVSKDEKYRLKAQELRSIFLDQPQTGLEKIVWWCEYVIRHKGAKHLRSPGADISLFEYFMLDILGIALVVLFVSYKVISMLVRLLLCRLRGCKKTGERKKNN